MGGVEGGRGFHESIRQSEPASNYPYDALVLLCGGVSQAPSGQWNLNFESALKVLATVEVYQQELTPTIISTGGALWGAPPMGKLMSETLQRFGVPQRAIIEENEATDTAVQAEKCIKIIQENGFQRVGVLGDSEHVKRAGMLFHNYGFPVTELAAEEFLQARERRHITTDTTFYKSPVDALHESDYWKRWQNREKWLRREMKVDPKQKLTRGIAIVTRTAPILRNLRAKGTE